VREVLDGTEWIRVDHLVPTGHAWAKYSEELAEALDVRLGATGGGAQPSAGDSPHHDRVAAGLAASAELDARCRQLGMPLTQWLGGTIRDEVQVSAPIVLNASDRSQRVRDVSRACDRVRQAAATFGVTAFAIFDDHQDPEVIAQAMASIRHAAGPDAMLLLRLSGQLGVPDARSLQQRLRESHLLALVDPCSSLHMSVEATRDALPAVGLSAGRYDRRALLHCLSTAPPVLLLIDPLIEGGPTAVRDLTGIARVLQVDVSLTAEDGGSWQVGLCAALSAVMPAARQPLVLPVDWTPDQLRAWDIRAGRLRSAAASNASPATDPISSALDAAHSTPDRP
jgi:L-alanine-DL-glutamate epimerase-like enolase superfamily enzyme